MEAKDYRFKFYHGEEECPEGVWPVGWQVEREFSENPEFIQQYFDEYEEIPIGKLDDVLREAKVDDIERASAYALSIGSDGPTDIAARRYLNTMFSEQDD